MYKYTSTHLSKSVHLYAAVTPSIHRKPSRKIHGMHFCEMELVVAISWQFRAVSCTFSPHARNCIILPQYIEVGIHELLQVTLDKNLTRKNKRSCPNLFPNSHRIRYIDIWGGGTVPLPPSCTPMHLYMK